jgi:hypothetical protein
MTSVEDRATTCFSEHPAKKEASAPNIKMCFIARFIGGIMPQEEPGQRPVMGIHQRS